MNLVSEKEIDVLNNMAMEAGELLLTLYDTELEIIQKGVRDFLTKADEESEKFIVNRSVELKLPYILVAEEKLDSIKFPLRLGNSGILYIDPLEGTHNFVWKRKEFGFGVTLGLVRGGSPVYIVFYNPVTKELYTAIRNGGAYKNNERIYVSERKDPEIVFNDWGIDDTKRVGKYYDIVRGVTDYHLTSGSDAVDICMVARGSFNGLVYIYKKAKPWDLIPALLIEESGGKVTNKKGDSWYTVDRDGFMKVGGSMIAGNPYMHQLLLSRLGTT